MATATQQEIKIVTDAIANAGLAKFAQFLSTKMTDAQWANFVGLAETKGKEIQIAELQRQIDELQAMISALS